MADPQEREPQPLLASQEPGAEEECQPVEEEGGFLFRDPYWDDAFASYYDPTLRTCCTVN